MKTYSFSVLSVCALLATFHLTQSHQGFGALGIVSFMLFFLFVVQAAKSSALFSMPWPPEQNVKNQAALMRLTTFNC